MPIISTTIVSIVSQPIMVSEVIIPVCAVNIYCLARKMNLLTRVQ